MKLPNNNRKNVFLEADIGLQSLDSFCRELWQKTQVVQRMEGAMQATIVGDGTSLIEVDVRMAAQFVKRELVDVQLARRRVLDDQIIFDI